MHISLKNRLLKLTGSDNEINRYSVYDAFCSPSPIALTLTLALGLSPNNLSLLKGQAMHDDAKSGRGEQLFLPIDFFDVGAQSADRQSNDVGLLQPQLGHQPVNSDTIPVGETNSGGADSIAGLSQSHILPIQSGGFQNQTAVVYPCEAPAKPQSDDYLAIGSLNAVSTVVPVGQDATSPLEWLLNPSKVAPHLEELGSGSTDSTFDRILARLIQLEAHEGEASLRDDYKIAWLIVRFCQTGEAVLCTPQVLATYRVVGCHPDQVWHRIMARRQALLGKPVFMPIRAKAARPSATSSASAAKSPLTVPTPTDTERKKA